MRVTFAAAATALLVAATACAAASSAGSARKPTLSVSAGKLHGSHFASREAVKVTVVAAGDSTTRRMRTSSAGTFATTLPPDKCLGTVLVVVRGASGDSARLKLPQRACAPALQPSPSG